MDPDILLYFLPGNPGLVDFYIPFLSGLYDRYSSSNLAIVGRGHLGHCPQIQDNPRHHSEESLTIQIQTSLEVLDAISTFYAKTRIVVIGHSVGAWLALQALEKRPKAILAVFLLFPTLSNIASTPNGRLLTPFFSPLGRQVLSSLAGLAKYLPESLLAFFFSHWPKQQLGVLREFISSPQSVHASLSMAHEEMKTIQDLDQALIEQHSNKLFFFYAETDGWVGKEKANFLSRFDPNNQSTNVTHGPVDVPHAFCINHSDLLAHHCHEWLFYLEKQIGSDAP